MKRRILLYSFLAMLLATGLACQAANWVVNRRTVEGSGKAATKELPVGSFRRVELAGLGRLDIELGGETGLRVEADDNLIDLVEAEVQGDTLVIRLRRGVNLVPRGPIHYTLSTAALEGITVSGLGEVNTPALEAPAFRIDVSGGGSVNLDELTADQLEVNISGLGSLTIAGGQVNEQTIRIEGGGTYEARDLASQRAQVEIPGLGTATVRVSDFLGAEISGGGQVRYLGSPQVEQNISGLGSVEKIEE